MSATTSAATGRCFGIQAGVSGLGALALGALRAAGAGTPPPAGRGAGAAGAGAEGHRTRSCWRRFVPISLGPRSTAKAIARSTHGFGSWMGSASPATRGAARHAGARTALPRTAGVRAPRRPTTGGSSPRRPTCCGGRTACGYSRSTTGGAGSSRQSNTGNAECVGWHVCKVGSRFAALDPIAQGLERLYGSLDADVARGLALRMDHGSQYLSDHFLKQIRYWGIPPQFRLCRGTRNERCGGAVESYAQGASDPRPNLSEPRGRPRRRGRLRGAVQPDLASREAWVSNADRGARGV